MNWKNISEDPNSALVKHQRVERIRSVRNDEPVRDRVSYFVEKVKGKRVLDVGIVEHIKDAYTSVDWLHRNIRDAAGYCLGIDILEEEVAYLKERGFNVKVHNLVEAPLDEKFDLVICGDVLEHVDNPGLFLDNLSQCLNPGGSLLFSLPNPWYLNYPCKNVWKSSNYYESVDHVAWYDAHTLMELMARHGFEMVEYRGIIITKVHSLKAEALLAAIPLLLKLGMRHELFSKTMVYEFKKK